MADNDLTVFVDACRKLRQKVSIRGSTAYVLARSPEFDPEEIKGSIVKSVPPLGDPDLIVRDPEPAEAMRRVGDALERYRTYVPASRFIHVDVFFDHMPVRRDSPLGNVKIDGLPEVTIGPENEELEVHRKRVQATVTPSVLATLFRDFLFLLRLSQRHEELENATKDVAELLQAQRPERVGLVTAAEGGVRELARIDKALVKHVLLRDRDREPRPMTMFLPVDWLRRFGSYLNGLSISIILLERHWERAQTIAYAVDGRVMEFGEVADLEDEERQVLEAKLAPESKSIMERKRLTPSLRVRLRNRDGSECCEYHDFSEGISELIWVRLFSVDSHLVHS